MAEGSSMEQVARTTKQIAAAVRRVRRSRNVTQSQLAKKINVRQATISSFETGVQGATLLQTAMDILAALDLELVIRPRTKASSMDIEAIF
jgi:HTH-type transcriptional regulator/antitoxin HipB